MEKIILGSTVKDIISDFQGVATGRVQYITGCNQILVQPKAANNSFIAAEWIDEQRLIVLENEIIKIDQKPDGFGQMAPVR